MPWSQIAIILTTIAQVLSPVNDRPSYEDAAYCGSAFLYLGGYERELELAIEIALAENPDGWQHDIVEDSTIRWREYIRSEVSDVARKCAPKFDVGHGN